MKRIVSLFVLVLACGAAGCGSESTVVHETATPQAMTGNTCGSEDKNCPPGQACINGKCTKTDDEPIPAQKEEPTAQIPDEGPQIQCDEHSCECDKTTCDQPDSCWRVAGYLPNVVCLDDGRIVDAICEDWTCGTGGRCDVECRDSEHCENGKCMK